MYVQFFKVFCDLKTQGGGWTTIQKRSDNPTPLENFHRTWQDYERGFGSPVGQNWIGMTFLY
jgi:hypothetical protein